MHAHETAVLVGAVRLRVTARCRLYLVPSHKLIMCGIEKNAITTITRFAEALQKQALPGPHASNMQRNGSISKCVARALGG